MLVAGLVVTAAALALTSVFAAGEGRTLAAAGADWAEGSLGRFAIGLAFGSVMVALLIALSRLALGPVAFARNPSVDMSAVWLTFATGSALAAGEELGFRGYPFHRLRDRYGTVPAQMLVALACATYHVVQGWPLLTATGQPP